MKLFYGLAIAALISFSTESLAQCTPTFTGSQTPCKGSTITYTTLAGGVFYLWNLSQINSISGTILGGGGTSDNFVTVRWDQTGSANIYVTIQTSGGCVGNSAPYSIAVQNPTLRPITVPVSMCAGVPGTFTTTPGKSNYTWSTPSGTIIGGGNTYTAQISFPAGAYFPVYVYYDDPAVCLSPTASYAATGTVADGPNRIINEPFPICPGLPATFTTAPGKLNYNWTVPTGATIVSGGNTASAQILFTSGVVGIPFVSVYYDEPTGCTKIGPSSTVVMPMSQLTPTLNSPAYACSGADAWFITDYGLSGYTWTVDGGTVTQGAGTYAIAVQWSTPGTKNVTVSYIGNGGCPSLTKTVSVIALSPITPSITGNMSACTGVPTVYTTQPGMSSYNWIAPSGGTVTAGGTSTSNTMTVSWSYSGPWSLAVSYTTPEGCYYSANATINAKLTITPSITGNATTCQGTPTFFSADGYGPPTSYTWTTTPDGTNSYGNSNSASFTWSTPGTKTISVTIASPTLCTTTITKTVNVLPYTTPVITGSAVACASSSGMTYTYSTLAGQSSYSWNSSGNISGSGNTVTVAWPNTGNQWIAVNYTSSNGCSAPAMIMKNVTVSGSATPTISGSTTTCTSTPTTYTTEAGMSNYIWSIPSGTTITAGGTTADNSITLNWTVQGTRNLGVTYTNAGGCSGSVTRSLTANARPLTTITALAPGGISLDGPNCFGADTYYSTEPYKSNYVWSFSSGGIIKATGGGGGSNDAFIVLQWSSSGSKFVSVSYSDPASSCGASAPTVLNLTIYPRSTNTLTGSNTACLGGTNNYTIVPDVPGTYQYSYYGIWGDGSLLNSSNSLPATFNTSGSTFVGASFKDSHGCLSLGAGVNVNVSTFTAGTTQTITFPTIADRIALDPPFDPVATSNRGLTPTYSSSNTAVATVAGTLVSPITKGTVTITASQAGNGCISAATNLTRTFTVLGKSQGTITFSALPTKTFGDLPFALTASVSSGLPVIFSSSNTSVATISGTTVTIVGAGTTTITASQAGNTVYDAAVSTAQSLTVNKASQAITFAALSPVTYGVAPFMLPATTSSGLAVSYTSSNAAVATVSGSMVTIVGAGSFTIYADQAGNANYLAAAQASQSLVVNKATQTITFASMPTKTCGTGQFDPGATASSGLSIVYTSADNAVATASGSMVTPAGAGTVSITANQPGNANYLAAAAVLSSLTVAKGSQTITFNAIPTKTFGDPAFAPATSSSGVAVSFASSNTGVATASGSTITIAGAGSSTITASQAGNTCWNAATNVDQTLVVNKANQPSNWISFTALQSQYCGVGSITLTATANLGAVTFSSDNTAVVTISGNTATRVGYGTVTITAAQGGNSNYNPVSTSQTINVGSAGGGISAYPSANICHTGGGTTITAGGGSNYSWNTSASGQSIFVTDVGTYTVTYTNSSGCAVTASINVIRQGTNCTNNRMAADKPDSVSTDSRNFIFGVSPNPATSQVLIRLSSTAIVDSPVSFIDMLGRTRKEAIIEKGQQEKTISIHDIDPGLYIINIRDSNGYRQRTLLIQNQ